MYELVLYAHILGAVIWVGGAVSIQLMALRAGRADDATEVPRLLRHFEALGRWLYLPASLVILLTGAFMAIQRWSLGQPWIAVAIGLWVLSAVAGAAYLSPRAKRAAALYESEGPMSPAARAITQRLFLVSRLELVSFAVIIGLMVFKPGS